MTFSCKINLYFNDFYELILRIKIDPREELIYVFGQFQPVILVGSHYISKCYNIRQSVGSYINISIPDILFHGCS